MYSALVTVQYHIHTVADLEQSRCVHTKVWLATTSDRLNPSTSCTVACLYRYLLMIIPFMTDSRRSGRRFKSDFSPHLFLLWLTLESVSPKKASRKCRCSPVEIKEIKAEFEAPQHRFMQHHYWSTVRVWGFQRMISIGYWFNRISTR